MVSNTWAVCRPAGGEAGLPGLHQPVIPPGGGDLGSCIALGRKPSPGGSYRRRRRGRHNTGSCRRSAAPPSTRPKRHGIAVSHGIGRQQGLTDRYHPAPRASHLHAPSTLKPRLRLFNPPARPAVSSSGNVGRSPDHRRRLPHHRIIVIHRTGVLQSLNAAAPAASSRACRGPRFVSIRRSRFGQLRHADLLPGAGYARRDSA